MAVLQSPPSGTRPQTSSREDALRRILLSFRRKVHRYFPEAVFDEQVVCGCSKDELGTYLSEQFARDMTWAGYGRTWVVQCKENARGRDLTKPREFYSYFHFKNFEPTYTKAAVGFKAYPDRKSPLDRKRPESFEEDGA